MQMQVNIHEAKSTLSKLVARVEDDGMEVVLCRAGRPAAKISPLPAKNKKNPRKIGVLAGKIEFFGDFNAKNDVLEGK